MSSCTSRKDDWSRFGSALAHLGSALKHTIQREDTQYLKTWALEVGHTGKNIVVEELRRWGFKIEGKKC